MLLNAIQHVVALMTRMLRCTEVHPNYTDDGVLVMQIVQAAMRFPFNQAAVEICHTPH